jgi:hypothetical protein
MMEYREIIHIVEENKQSNTYTATDMDEIRNVDICNCCKEDPCLWLANKEAMLRWDESKHGLLMGDGIPLANLCRK